MSEYIHTNKFDTNESPNMFVTEKLIRTNVRLTIRDLYIRIFEYIRHTLDQMVCHTFSVNHSPIKTSLSVAEYASLYFMEITQNRIYHLNPILNSAVRILEAWI